MTTIVREALDAAGVRPQRWSVLARQAAGWAQSVGVEMRDAVVLVPFTELLPHARSAFSELPGWMPKVETTRTLAAALAPAAPCEAGQLTLDPAVDGLLAIELLRSQPWGAAWARRDPRGFAQAATRVVETAHALVRASAAVSPDLRVERWAQWRDLLPAGAGPGGTERLLARVALEWARLAPAPITDSLFAYRPAAWICLQAGGPDDFTRALLAASPVPSLLIDTDAWAESPFDAAPFDAPPGLAVCDSFEHEAQCAAAQVIDHLNRAEQPVALIAQDRELVRRVRALLERQQIGLLDETGWRLSTTRAAAQLMALLRAARRDAGTDDLLDWLKGAGPWWLAGEPLAVSALETACRRKQVSRVAALAHIELDAAAARLWGDVSAWLATLSASGPRSLAVWTDSLAAVLARCGALPALQADDAGGQVLLALRLPTTDAERPAWPAPASAVLMTLAEFTGWVGATLEGANFVPAREGPESTAQVVITPMARAMLRPFAAVVLPGADNRHLGASPAPQGLLSDAQAQALGMTTSAHRRQAELLAFAQVLHVPRLTLMRRRVDGNEPLSTSPLVERLALALAARGTALARWSDPRVDLVLAPTPVGMTAPSAAALAPSQLSATACEALRACPYRFFALHLLALREDNELGDEVEKSDYGTWLHAVLFDFHTGRTAPGPAAAETERLLALASRLQSEKGLGDADFLPFAASFAALAPRYVEWLHERDADGAVFERGEDEVIARPPELAGVALKGVIDRIDSVRNDGSRALQLVDYKTGGASALKGKVREPFEDTQLAFYAALVRSQTDAPLKAMYLALDGTDRIEEIVHDEVERSATALLSGLAHDLHRLRAGAGLPALGEGRTCDHCAARGVCRRDHWSARATESRGAAA